MKAHLDGTYDVFVRSSDRATWSACLGEYLSAFDGTADLREVSPIHVRRALTIAVFVGWLARKEGDSSGADAANQRARLLEERMRRAAPSDDPGEATMITALAAATRGYAATARNLLAPLKISLPVELAVLTAPERGASRAAWLRPYVVDGTRAPFSVAVSFYGNALLGLGYRAEAAALAARYHGHTSCGSMTDLIGTLRELAGEWEAAREVYAASKWAVHAYRAAVCGLILGDSVESLADWPPDIVSRFTSGMLDFGNEADHAEAVRSESFVRACRWGGFDNWLVHFELGRLGFQRRRHAEAERHLAAAAHTAPPKFRHPILSLRFANLTWLGDGLDLDLSPETMVAAHSALAVAPEGADADIRTWLAEKSGDHGLTEPVLTGKDAHEAGVAHALLGRTPDALAAWCASVSDGYVPRAILRLIGVFATAGFRRTAAGLGEIVLREADEDFLQVWELADLVACSVGLEPPRDSVGEPLHRLLVAVEARLQALARSDFQNAIRAFQHFRLHRRNDAIPSILRRAEKLAESAEEHLRLAIARRLVSNDEVDPRALHALRRAEQESEDRLERLLVAREFARLGQRRKGREILTAEGVFDETGNLTPIEFIVAVDVARKCAVGDRERLALEQSAKDTLRRDGEAGRFAWYGPRFGQRLGALLQQELELPGAREPEVRGEDAVWRTFERMARQAARPEETLHILTEQTAALEGTSSFPTRLALWELHRDGLIKQMRAIDRLRPSVPDGQVPMAYDTHLVRPRAQRLGELWRRTLLTADGSVDTAAVQAYLREEEVLADRWLTLRAQAAASSVAIARRFTEQCERLLDALADEVRQAPAWPSFLALEDAFVADTRDLERSLVQSADIAGTVVAT